MARHREVRCRAAAARYDGSSGGVKRFAAVKLARRHMTFSRLRGAIEAAESSEGVPVAPVEAIVYMKLASPRSRDRQDVIELVRAGIDVEKVRHYLDRYAPQLRDGLEEAVKIAAREEG